MGLLIVIFMKMQKTCERAKKRVVATFPNSQYIKWSVGMRGTESGLRIVELHALDTLYMSK